MTRLGGGSQTTDEGGDVEDRSDDFGLTRLAAGEFVPGWWDRHASADALLRDVARRTPPEVLEQYVHDASSLVASPLTGAQLAALWTSATGGHHAPSVEGRDGRQWFARIAEILAPAVPDAAAFDADAARDLRPEAVSGVVAVVRTLSVRRDLGAAPADERHLRRALVELAEGGFPELALRFFLSLAMEHLSPVPRSLYAEIRRVGAAFGYGPFIVERLEGVIDIGAEEETPGG
ncbi:hypothetical protein ABZ801_27900 [Actinomadura sp. NPDC047616]|uniref:hypothetical protein n=1 Tax=Actinomadura sp. NPDC047616 TaxID=3155914 RepID=UPI0033E35ED6